MKTVVIIGRPNVGKSTLFNRLIGKRAAITDPTSGVTRDLIRGKWIINGCSVELIDSGGIKTDSENLERQVMEKSLSLLEKSDLILFLMDCTEVTAEDRFVIEKLRAFSDKVILLVNKIDDVTRENLIWNYYEFGFQRVLGISSAHGNGIGELEETVFGVLALQSEDSEDMTEGSESESVIKLALMGKPNTGKSTLTNLLSGDDISIVSPVPGTTRDVVSGSFTYKDYSFTIYDTAGIRRKSKIEDDVEYYSVNRAIKTIDNSEVILLMVDVNDGLTEQDKKISELVVRRGKGLLIVLNKEDLLTNIKNGKTAIEDRVRFLFPLLNYAPICFISAQKSSGIKELLDRVIIVKKQLMKRIDTSVLNQYLSKWTSAHEIQRSKNGYFKIFYSTQISVNPVKFLMFVNRRKGFPETYIQYLKNCIRKDLGFSYVPVEIDLRERERSKSKKN